MQNENRYANASYASPRELTDPRAREGEDDKNGYTSPKLRINPQAEFRAAKTVGKQTSTAVHSLD